VRDVILKPRDEAKDLPAAWSDVGRLIIFHYSFFISQFSFFNGRTNRTAEIRQNTVSSPPCLWQILRCAQNDMNGAGEETKKRRNGKRNPTRLNAMCADLPTSTLGGQPFRRGRETCAERVDDISQGHSGS
jgi:hypothetical protein